MVMCCAVKVRKGKVKAFKSRDFMINDIINDVTKNNIRNMIKNNIRNTIKNNIIIILIIVFIVAIANAENERTVSVIRVIDGDTIVVNNENGSEEIIRLVGINTPEIGVNGSNESKSYVENKILGKQIHLDVDDKKPKDIYNRTLAVIFVGEENEKENLNKELLCKNLAQVVYIPPSEFNPYVWQSECTGGHVKYRVFVDQYRGFYKISDITTLQPVSYENHTLDIKQGDIIMWENRADPDWPLTIISKEGLWENRTALLRWNYQKFSYTFNNSGKYEVYIKEYPREEHQIIMVGAKDTIITVTPIETPTATPSITTPSITTPSITTPSITTPSITTPSITTPSTTAKTSGFSIIIGLFGILATILIFKLKERIFNK